MIEDPELRKKVTAAKLSLMSRPNSTFYATALAALQLELSHAVHTAATDGTHILFNPEFIPSLNQQELIGLMLHELRHVLLQHMIRQKEHDLDPEMWNCAADHYINLRLLKEGYQLPKNGLFDKKYEHHESTMAIYLDLINDPAFKFPEDLSDLIFTSSDNNPSDNQALKEKVISIAVSAAMAAEQANDAGSIPGDIKRLISEFVDPKLPWNVLVQSHVSALAQQDYTWRKPSKKFWPDLYMPTLFGQVVEKIMVIVDVSGSITQKMLDEFFAEMREIKNVLQPSVMRIVSFDTCIREDLVFTETDEITHIEFTGGGGTDFDDVVKLLREDQPEIAIVFTDLEFSMPNLSGIDTDMIWVNTGTETRSVPNGVVINY